MITADKATISLFKYKSTEVGYWFCLEETEKNNSEYFHDGSKIDNYNGRQCKIAKSSKCWIKLSQNRIFKMGC